MLLYRAGPRALARLRKEGLRPQDVRVLVGPASGPKWLVFPGVDRALMEHGFGVPRKGQPHRLLVGSSAGSWRMLALAARHPHQTYERLIDGYVSQTFPMPVRAKDVTPAFRRMLSEVFSDDDLAAITSHANADVAIHVTRVFDPYPWSIRAAQIAAIAMGIAVHRVWTGAVMHMARRVLAHTRPDRFGAKFRGTVIPLTPSGIRETALASGTIPVYMQPIRDVPGAPRGTYVDGGLADYHIRQAYTSPGEGITLLPHYQEAVQSCWFDRATPHRETSNGALADVLQLYPSPAWIRSLPGGKVPDRDDFFLFAKAHGERIRRWNETVSRSEELGEQLRRDLETGNFVDRLSPIATRAT